MSVTQPKLESTADEGTDAKRLIKQDDGRFLEVPRVPKRRYAILVSYCGSGYHGLQINPPPAKTIEYDLAKAFFCAGGILDTNVHKLQRIGWSRAARTDKGVHAAMNVVTAKLMIGDGQENERIFVERANKHLPEAVRIIRVDVVTKSYNAQRMCSKRRYEYVMPTFVFQRDPTISNWRQRPQVNCFVREFQNCDTQTTENVECTKDSVCQWKRGFLEMRERRRLYEVRKRQGNSDVEMAETGGVSPEEEEENNDESISKVAIDSHALSRLDGMQTGARMIVGRLEGFKRRAMAFQKEAQLQKIGRAVLTHGGGRWALADVGLQTAQYRLDVRGRQMINKLLGMYVGTHKFHNFTTGKSPTDMSSQRYIMSFDCSEPFLSHGVEFVALQVVGQSFMLHQIRKMCGLVVILMRRGVTDDAELKDIFASAFSSHQWPVPTVPPDGLFLNRLYFEGYNKKAAKVTERVKDLDRRSLAYDDPELVKCLDAFKRQYIHSHIAQRIVLYRPFDAWIRTISSHWMPLPHGTPLEDVKIIGGERARERERQEKKRARQAGGNGGRDGFHGSQGEGGGRMKKKSWWKRQKN